MKKYSAILAPGIHARGEKIYEGSDSIIHLTEEELLHFESCSLVRWSDHPQVQHRLAKGEWKKAREEVIAKGRSLNYFHRTHKPPKPENIKGIVVPLPEKMKERSRLITEVVSSAKRNGNLVKADGTDNAG